MTIKTTYINPPIPHRDRDWCAHFDGDEDNASAPRGWGETEQFAVVDLLQKSLFHDDDYSDDIINLAVAGWEACREK